MRGRRRSLRSMGKRRNIHGRDYYWLINIFLVMLLVTLILPTLIVRGCRSSDVTSTQKTKTEEKKITKVKGPDLYIKLYDHYEKKIIDITLEEYVKGVLSAEMPVSFNLEALKAQAVAARTLAARKLRSLGGPGDSKYKGADVCSRFDHCQAWESEAMRRKKWGKAYEANEKKITQAVEETWGEIVTYQDKPIEVFFHSTSGGMTENVEEVFSAKLPYLRSVPSEGEEDAPHFQDVVSIAKSKFVSTFKKSYPKANLTVSNLQSQVKISSRTASGRIRAMRIGGITIKGTDVRKLYQLYSTNFTITYSGSSIVFHTKGYGHGVGMSQVGANSMAGSGSDYKEILTHYYEGIEVTQLSQLMANK